MVETYLNGKITVSSLAAPTQEDLALIATLSDDERQQMLEESLLRADESPVVDVTMDEIWQNALMRYKEKHAIPNQ